MQLNRSQVSLRPTQHGLLFLIILVSMLLGSINYNNNAGFMLVFLLGTMALISLFHSYRNLVGLEIRLAHVHPVFAGQFAVFSFQVKGKPRDDQISQGQALFLGFENLEGMAFSLKENTRRVDLKIKAEKRGVLVPNDLILTSVYPFGLFSLKARIPVSEKGLVYPAPISGRFSLSFEGDKEGEEESGDKTGPDDFQGLVSYVPGSPMGRISWKTFSRGLGLFIKNFTADAGGEIVLDMNLIKAGDLERKLSLICRSILDSKQENIRYGIRLGSTLYLSPGSGEAHYRRCMKALALYGIEEALT